MAIPQKWDEALAKWDDVTPPVPPVVGTPGTQGDTGTNTPTTRSYTTGAGETYLLVKVGIVGVSVGNVATVTFGAASLTKLIEASSSGIYGALFGGVVPAGTTATVTVTYGGGSNANGTVAITSYANVVSAGTPKSNVATGATSTLTFDQSGAHVRATDFIATHFGDNDPTAGATQEYASFQDGGNQCKQEGQHGIAATLTYTGLNHPNRDAIHLGVPLLGGPGVGATWDPPPPSASFGGALLGTGKLNGVLVLGLVDLEGGLRGTGLLAGALKPGANVSGALLGTGVLVGSTIQIGLTFRGDLVGIGTVSAVFVEPPPGQILGGSLIGLGTLSGFLPGVVLVLPHLFGPDSPVSQTPHLDANFNAILAEINAPNLLGIGPIATRPAPGRQGAIYVVTDQNDEWFMDDGLTWHGMGAFGHGMVVHDQAQDNLWLLGATAAGAGAHHVISAGKATTIPSQALIDGAVLYVADVQNLPGRAAWHHLSEAGHRTPLDPVLFRGSFLSLSDSALEQSLFADGVRTLVGKTLPGRYLEVWWRGDYGNASGAIRTLILRLRYGGTELVTVTMTGMPVLALGTPLSAGFRLDGLTGAVQLALPVTVQGQGTVTYANAVGAVDATLDQPLDLTAQWSLQAPTLTVRTLALSVTLR